MGGDFAKFCGLLRIYELYKCSNGIICNNSFEDFVEKIAMDKQACG
jgi:hypothetical protein